MIRRWSELLCDVCKVRFEPMSGQAGEVRELAHSRRWQVNRWGKCLDLCPECTLGGEP